MLKNQLLPARGATRLDAIGPEQFEAYNAQALRGGREKSIDNDLAVLGKPSPRRASAEGEGRPTGVEPVTPGATVRCSAS